MATSGKTKIITLGDGLRVTLRQYLAAVKLAKANPDTVFTRGFTCWWSCKGSEVMRQFRHGAEDRMRQRVATQEPKESCK